MTCFVLLRLCTDQGHFPFFGTKASEARVFSGLFSFGGILVSIKHPK